MVNTILTDDEIANLMPNDDTPMSLGEAFYTQARAVEAAVQEKLAQQEPVAWIRPSGKAMLEAGGYCTVYASDGMSNHSAPLYTRPAPQQADRQRVPEGWKLVPVEALTRWRDAFAEELAAYDIDPPIHHVLTSHDEIAAMLAAAPEAPAQADAAEAVNDTNAILASRYFDLLKVVEAYEKNGVTCQTFRHFVAAPCAECNAAPEAPAQASAVDERAIDAAARKIAECMDYPWEHMPEKGRSTMRDHAKAVLDAARAALAQKGGAA